MEGQRIKPVLEKSLRLYTKALVLIFALLLVRVAWLQIIKTEPYRMQAKSNTVRQIPDVAPRGEITDRNSQVLVTNRPVFNLTLDYLGLKDQSIEDVSAKLAEILQDPEITADSIKEAVKAQKNRLYEPIVLKRDIPIELMTSIEERRRDLPGVNIDSQPQRSYPFGSLAGHLLGYVHSIKEELEQPEYANYGLGDLVGKTGVERSYEQYLRGQNGYRQVEVTANNKPVREMAKVPATAGDKLVLTLDVKLQQTMEKAFDETLANVQKAHPKAKAGGAVLLDVKTGQVLAMVSRPTLNPDDFNGKPLKQELVDYYFRNTPTALTNRAIQGKYVPGSTFKPVTAMAALESGNATPQSLVTCSGRYWLPPYIKCTGVHGTQTMAQGMAHSCNVYFQEMARRAGIAEIGKVGREFGLGLPTGIDLPFESTGLLPDLEWQNSYYGLQADRINKKFDAIIATLENDYMSKMINASEQDKKRLQQELNGKKKVQEQQRKLELDYFTQWHDFDTFNTGIGQGYNQYTMIEIANYVATIANGGKHYKPYTVSRVLAPDGSTVLENQPTLVNTVTVSPQNIEAVKEGMMAVTAPGGTAYSLFKNFPPTIKVAAKTGTAQPGRAGYVKNQDYDGLFIAFAPADDPQIAFAGVIEFGWSGSGSIGLVAKAVFEQYFGVMPVELKLETSGAGDQPVQTTPGTTAPAAENPSPAADETTVPAGTETGAANSGGRTQTGNAGTG